MKGTRSPAGQLISNLNHSGTIGWVGRPADLGRSVAPERAGADTRPAAEPDGAEVPIGRRADRPWSTGAVSDIGMEPQLVHVPAPTTRCRMSCPGFMIWALGSEFN